MKPFVTHEGGVAPLIRNNIDTDAIIPSREMRRVSKRGLGAGLFAGWRYLDDRQATRAPNPDFVLNKPEYADASILLAGSNFGCGSSREHAVWALLEYGFRVVIAPDFGSIFYHNALRNGLLPVRLPEQVVHTLSESVGAASASVRVSVDLQNCTVGRADGAQFGFAIEPIYREMLLQGMDSIDLTLQRQQQIDAFQSRDRRTRGWAYL